MIKKYLFRNWVHCKNLVRINNHLYKQRDPKEYDPFQENVFVPEINFPHINHLAEVNYIIDYYNNLKRNISESDKDRFRYLSGKNINVDFESHFPSEFLISAFDALEILERDLHFLVSAAAEEHPDGDGRIEKGRVCTAIASDRPSALVGMGSKVILAVDSGRVIQADSGHTPVTTGLRRALTKG